MFRRTLPSTEECIAPGMHVEQRPAVRYLCDRDVACSEVSTRERLGARLRNISISGIGLLLHAPIPAGTDLEIEVRTKHPDRPLRVLARVVHATKQAEGNWIIGCTLVRKPMEEHLLALL